MLSDEIKQAIKFKETARVNFVLGSAVQNDFGNWETAECFLDEAVAIDNEIAVLQSICDETMEVPVRKSTCDITKKGIGFSSIQSSNGKSDNGCAVMKVVKTNLPPPYGEFKRGEFKTTDFTEEITE